MVNENSRMELKMNRCIVGIDLGTSSVKIIKKYARIFIPGMVSKDWPVTEDAEV